MFLRGVNPFRGKTVFSSVENNTFKGTVVEKEGALFVETKEGLIPLKDLPSSVNVGETVLFTISSDGAEILRKDKLPGLLTGEKIVLSDLAKLFDKNISILNQIAELPKLEGDLKDQIKALLFHFNQNKVSNEEYISEVKELLGKIPAEFKTDSTFSELESGLKKLESFRTESPVISSALSVSTYSSNDSFIAIVGDREQLEKILETTGVVLNDEIGKKISNIQFPVLLETVNDTKLPAKIFFVENSKISSELGNIANSEFSSTVLKSLPDEFLVELIEENSPVPFDSLKNIDLFLFNEEKHSDNELKHSVVRLLLPSLIALKKEFPNINFADKKFPAIAEKFNLLNSILTEFPKGDLPVLEAGIKEVFASLKFDKSDFFVQKIFKSLGFEMFSDLLKMEREGSHDKNEIFAKFDTVKQLFLEIENKLRNDVKLDRSNVPPALETSSNISTSANVGDLSSEFEKVIKFLAESGNERLFQDISDRLNSAGLFAKTVQSGLGDRIQYISIPVLFGDFSTDVNIRIIDKRNRKNKKGEGYFGIGILLEMSAIGELEIAIDYYKNCKLNINILLSNPVAKSWFDSHRDELVSVLLDKNFILPEIKVDVKKNYRKPPLHKVFGKGVSNFDRFG